MKTIKKICALLIACVVSVSSAFAVLASDTQQIAEGEAAAVDVTVTVESAVITASVPTQMTVAIDPNQVSGQTVTSSTGTLTNSSNAPIDVQFIGAKAAQGTVAKVVGPDAYGAWAGLGVTQTQKNIAIGFVASSKDTYWSKAEAENNTASLGAVKLMPKESGSFKLDALHGNAWPQATALKYIVTLRIALSA